MTRESLLIMLISCACAVCLFGCTGDGVDNQDAGADAAADVDTDTDTNTSTDLVDSGTNSISDMTMEINPAVTTILVMKWTQATDVDSVRVEFTYENDEWLASPDKTGEAGPHSEVILGVPEYTEIKARIVNELGETTWRSSAITGSNDGPPPEMPRPELIEYDQAAASPQRWLMGSVENSEDQYLYWESAWWAFIIDRKARIVWYYPNPLGSRILFPRIAPDGTHIIFDEHQGGTWGGYTMGLRRRTLDLQYGEDIPVDGINWCWDITGDEHILYTYFKAYDYETGHNGVLRELSPDDGSVRDIWNCAGWITQIGLYPSSCYSNTVNWVEERGSVIVNLAWDPGTILEIDRQTGEVKSQWGNLEGSWEFNPPGIRFDLAHFPDITSEGTLLVSSREDPYGNPSQRIMEFEIDDANKVLNQIWSYGEGEWEFAQQGGEATRVDNGNTLISYGTGGVIKEVTPDKQTAWSAIFDASFSPETNNKLVGHLTLIDDLYAINRGPSE